MKPIIISVVFVVLGIGIMSMAEKENTIKTIGGGLFIVGTIMLALSLYNVLKNGKK